jgi:hypothetical protein
LGLGWEGETQEDVGKWAQAKGALVMLQWGCWDMDIWLGLLWGRDCDSGGYVGGAVAIDEWEVNVIWKDGCGWCYSHATFAQERTQGVVGVAEDGEVGEDIDGFVDLQVRRSRRRSRAEG